MSTQIDSYNFFLYIFSTIPDKAFVEKILSQEFASEAPGVDLIKNYIKSVKDKSIDDIFNEISVDRTYLLYGLRTEGPRPPHASLYVKADILEASRFLNRTYRKYGFKILEGNYPPDHITVQMAFMKKLYEQGDASYDARKDFFTNNLGKWGKDFAQEMIKFAKTDFFRGIGHLFESFLEEEMAFYSN